jgi:hypothetical protein
LEHVSGAETVVHGAWEHVSEAETVVHAAWGQQRHWRYDTEPLVV